MKNLVRVSIPMPYLCAGCRKPIDPERSIVHVGPLEGGLTWHRSCYQLRELSDPKEFN
jgi:hypothetical protein